MTSLARAYALSKEETAQLSDDAEKTAGAPVRALGKFLFAGSDKLYVRGVTYGTFKPDDDGHEYPDRRTVERDFRLMADNGINAVRTYTPPPRWLLDIAQRHGLRVMVGLAAERYVGFLTDRRNAPDIIAVITAGVRACAGHPALLCYAIANEIPASSVRWLGARRVERYLRRLHDAVKKQDPGGLVTYVSYPSTEYLRLPFLDVVCFNVYLESEERFSAYLARLHNIAGERPLLLAEIGLDSMRNGETSQAATLAWQVSSAFAGGCAGAFVYAWTDEWFRGGAEVDDWAFGLTTKARFPKPALATVRNAFAAVPLDPAGAWPSFSVVVCTYNGSRTIHETLDGLRRLDYPNFEVIIVDDGSTDSTPSILAESGFRVIRTPNHGLSAARNVGLHAASGEIVAYIDDDAYPDPHWLTYLAEVYRTTTHAGVGGPNIPPPGDGPVADCVAHAPGGAAHVLLSDTVAEHIPGCNCSFRRDALLAVNGFDPQFRIAGDDVDLCWRIQKNGGTIGFSGTAVVWHHRRNAVRAYLRQQQNYGRAEALLERKWPEKYNAFGHAAWAGRIYSTGLTLMLKRAGRIYHGLWGSAPFQLLYTPRAGLWSSLPLMPEWYLLIAALALLSTLGLLWTPLLFFLPLLAGCVSVLLAQALLSASKARFTARHGSPWSSPVLRALTAALHLLQPLARLRGRFANGLTAWRWRTSGTPLAPWPRTWSLWIERWRDPFDRLKTIEAQLQRDRAFVFRGRDHDRWDLQAGGLFGGARLLMGVEDHGGGCQLVRFRVWPVFPVTKVLAAILFVALAGAAALDHAMLPAAVLGLSAMLLGARAIWEAMMAAGVAVEAANQAWNRVD